MGIVATKDRFQINHKNPQVVDGSLYAILEEQFTYEWFLREAHNWTLVSTSFAYKLERAPTMKLIWMNWAPAGMEVQMSNYWDENLARLYINYWWKASLGEIDWRLEIQTLGIKIFLNPIVGGWYTADIFQTLLDMQTLLNLQTEVKDVYVYKWTPGEGDNTLTTIPSLERILQEEQANKGVV